MGLHLHRIATRKRAHLPSRLARVLFPVIFSFIFQATWYQYLALNLLARVECNDRVGRREASHQQYDMREIFSTC